MEKYLIVCFLTICALFDWKRKQIPTISLWIGGIVMSIVCIVQIVLGTRTIWDSFGGILVGLFLLFISFITRQQIGLGDGILFVITGIGLGFFDNIILLMSSLFLTSIVALSLFVAKKIKRKETLPFIPFVWVSFICILLKNIL